MSPLPFHFYQRDDVVQIAQELLGKKVFSTIGGILTGGMIIETEAYRGPDDRACHAYQYRRTPRNEVMFQRGGIAYIYLCYGMHHLLNVVTSGEGNPHAVLIRALHPTHGLKEMQKRRKKGSIDPTLTNGPGALCQALRITREYNGHPLNQLPLWIEEGNLPFSHAKIYATPRIGIDYAKEDVKRPWRFVLDIQEKNS